jgi:Flp pilus assembly pilin Flp
MVDDMNGRRLHQDSEGVVSVEYVVFVAAIGTAMVIGVTLLFDAMSTFLGNWATYFGG